MEAKAAAEADFKASPRRAARNAADALAAYDKIAGAAKILWRAIRQV